MPTIRLALALVLAATAVSLAQRGPGGNGVMPSQIHQPPPNTPIPAGSGRISGRVVDRERQTPIANAAVSIELLAPGTGARRAIASRVLTTDDVGEFVERDLAFGDYAVVASVDGYTPARRLGSTIDNGEAVSLSPNRPDGAVTVRHSRVGTISGVVTDADGAPIPRATVRILHHVFVGAALMWQPMPVVTVTDVAGRFAFTNVPPGDYVVGVLYRSYSVPSSVFDAYWKPASPANGNALRSRLADSNALPPPAPAPAVGGPASIVGGHRWFVRSAIDQVLPTADWLTKAGRRMTTFSGGAGSVANARVISVEAGAVRTDADIRVRTASGVRVSGTLVGDPAQVRHVGLRLMTPGEADVLQTFGGEVGATVTDDQGRFTFLDVPPGAMTIEAELTESEPNQAGPPRRRIVGAAHMRLEVGAGGAAGLEVPLKALLTVRGRLTFASDSTDPRPPATLPWLMPVGARGNGFAIRPRATAADEFVFENVRPGRYLLNVSGFGNWRVSAMTAAGQNVLHRAIDVTSGDILDVVLTFAHGVNRMRGIVRNATGATLEGAQVVAFPADYATWASEGRSQMLHRSTLAATGGVYTFNALVDGEYFVAAFPENTERDWMSMSVLAILAKTAVKVRIAGGVIVTQDVVAKAMPSGG